LYVTDIIVLKLSESRGCPSFKTSKGDAVVFYRPPTAEQRRRWGGIGFPEG